MLIRYHRMRGKRTKWILGTDHAGIATQKQVEKRLAAEGTSREADRPRGVRASACGSGASSTAARSSSSSSASARRSTTTTSASRSTTRYARRRPEGLRRPLREGLIYRDNYMVNWDPGSRLGDLRPRGRGPRGHRHAVLRRLPARGRRRATVDGRDRAPRDDAGRHGGRGAPGRRALPRPVGRDGDPAARRAASCRSSPTTTSSPSSAPAR